MWGDGQGGSRGAVRGSMVVAAEAAYAEGEAGNEAVCWASLWLVIDSDGEIGFRGGLSWHWCWCRRWLQLVMEASPASGKGTVCQVRTGWIEAEEFSKYDLELVFSECWFHVLNAVYVGQSGDVVEKGWGGPGGDFLVDLECCPTADFPGVEYIVGSDGSVVFERLNEEGKRGGGAPWVVPGGGSRSVGKGCN